MKLQYSFIFILLTLQGCYISKTVKTPCTLRIDKSFSVNMSKPDDPKYLKESQETLYKEKFIDGLKEELTTYNVTVIENDVEKADFELKITSFSLKETMNTSTVDDAASPYNGQSYALHSCNADVNFILYKDGKEMGDWYAGVIKEEKLTNNRNVGDYIFGANKDGSEYRHKQLDENIFEDLSGRAGRRTAARITKKISK